MWRGDTRRRRKRLWWLCGPASVFIFTCMANLSPSSPTTSRWRSFTVQSQSHHLGLKDGRFTCSHTSLLLFTWRVRQTQPMYFQDCRWTTSRSGKGTLQRSTSIMNAVPKALSLEQIETATATDPVLQQVHNCLNSSEWLDTPELKPYKRIQHELCV